MRNLILILVSVYGFALPQAHAKNINTSAISAQVDALKTEIMSEKVQVIILKDLLKKEGLDGSRKSLIIAFENNIGKRYLIDSVTYKLNGEIIYQFVAENRMIANAKLEVPQEKFEYKIVPGPYKFEVQVVYRGNDTGVFSYIKDYRVVRESSLNLEVKNEDRITVSAFESGGVFADFREKPQLKISR